MKLPKVFLGVLLPLVVFAIPLALGNRLSQPVALVLLLPLLFWSRAGLRLVGPFLLVVLCVSAVQAYLSREGYSLYQFLRSGIPFAFLCIILAGYWHAQRKIESQLGRISDGPASVIDKVILFFAVGQLLQVMLHFSGVALANAATIGQGGERILLFPTTGSILLFFYACCMRKYLVILVMAGVLVATGSKAVLALMAAMVVLSMIYIKAPRRLVGFAIAGLGSIAMVFSLNPLALDRTSRFLVEDRVEDVTRAYEISHAQHVFFRDVGTTIFGNGLAAPLTPGVPTPDDRWFENSRYDIENAYWALLAKLGIFGCAFLAFLFLRLPRDITTVALLGILVVFGLKTSYQFFTTFDGSILLMCSILVRYRLALDVPLGSIGTSGRKVSKGMV